MTSDRQPPGWGTKHELQFVGALCRRSDAADLLRGYLNASMRRWRWDRIDPAVVIPYAQGKLNEIEMKGAK